MEEKVYYRQVRTLALVINKSSSIHVLPLFISQVTKLSLSRRIVDEEQMDRYFASNDLTDLYSFDVDGQLRLPDSVLGHENSLHPNDELLSDLAVRMKEWIGAYREHDSLLQNRPEEYIETAEREAIWKIFQETKVPVSSQEVPN